MKLPSKKIDFLFLPALSRRGSAMTLVLFFASIGMIIVFSYLMHQMAYSKPSLRSPTSLQALLNARSGIYRAFYQIIDSTGSDTLRTINPLDSLFGSEMFSDNKDTLPPEELKPELDGVPVAYSLFSDSSEEDCEVTLEPAGGKCRLVSVGHYKSVSRTAEALLGCPIPAYPDTTVIYYSSYEWSGNKPLGTVVQKDGNPVFNSEWYNSLIDRYQTDLTDADTLMLDPPLTISSTSDIKKIKSPVNGPLLIDGSGIGITWNDTGTYIIKSDLQITGDVTLSGMRFIVAGEIKILDKSNLADVDLFTSSRLFIGDQSVFKGNALALHSITVYGKANITDRSSLIAGSDRASAKDASSSDSLKFSLLFAEESSIDGVCIALGTPGSIKTDQTVSVRGILWAKHLICHRGTMKGCAVATRFVDCDDPVQMATDSLAGQLPADGSGTTSPKDGGLVALHLNNAIPGEIGPLETIQDYALPFFMGRLAIISWKER